MGRPAESVHSAACEIYHKAPDETRPRDAVRTKPSIRSFGRNRASDVAGRPTRRSATAESCDTDAYPNRRTTSRKSYPGFLASSAAASSRTRSITRLSVACGVPACPKLRLKCSRVTASAFANSCVRTTRPARPAMNRQALRCIRVSKPSSRGGSARAVANLVEKPWTATACRSIPSSTPSARMSATPQFAHAAIAGASTARNGVTATNATLGNSRASDVAASTSSGPPRSTTTRSTSVACSLRSSVPSDRVIATRPSRREMLVRTNSRVRARGACATTSREPASATCARRGVTARLRRRAPAGRARLPW